VEVEVLVEVDEEVLVLVEVEEEVLVLVEVDVLVELEVDVDVELEVDVLGAQAQANFCEPAGSLQIILPSQAYLPHTSSKC
jgi:hypothetical protein